MVAKLATIGIVPGTGLRRVQARSGGGEGARRRAQGGTGQDHGIPEGNALTGDSKLTDGWFFTTKTGLYGTNYLMRALVTAIGLGANRPQDAVYPTSEGPDILKTYSGANHYVMHFNKGELPPVDGFWSLTMYDADYFFVPNPINRYTVSQRNKLKANNDGSVDLYIQNDSPGKDKEQNWLPAPKDKFILMMRLYWPKEKPPSLLDGSWKIPAVNEVT